MTLVSGQNLFTVSAQEECIIWIECLQELSAPATPYISYERRTLWRSIEPDNIYTGEPRPELDNAWHELMKRASRLYILVTEGLK